MPTISHQSRPQVGGTSQEAAPTRTTITASTGMTMPNKTAPIPGAAPVKTGQPGITEETPAAAVTLSPQLTALARKQQRLQSEIQAQREKEAQWTAREADYIPKSTIQAKAKQNAAEALKEALGMDYEELTALLIAQQNGNDPVTSLRSEVDQLKRSQEENVNKQYEATLKQYRNETDSLVAADTKAFHFLNKGKKAGEWGDDCPVVKHIVETWEENPDKVLTVSQAAKEIEEFLREDAKAKAAALRELDQPAEETTQQKRLPSPKSGARTLTQSVETTPTRIPNQFQHLSMKERIAQSIARAQK